MLNKIKNYYIDESGNSGDLVRAQSNFEFSGQQVFVLACIGINDEKNLGAELSRLRAKHHVQATEVKSTHIKKKPKFIEDIAAFIKHHQLPLMVELVDKKFFIVANIINTLVLPPVGESYLMPEDRYVRNVMAEYVHTYAPVAVIEAYIQACDDPTNTSVKRAFVSLLTWLDCCQQNDEVARCIAESVRESFDEFQSLCDTDSQAIFRYLPVPDSNKRGQSIWMLPNLSSLTNIYARINKLLGRSIDGVTITHDEQLHFDTIFQDSKTLAETLGRSGELPVMPHSDYRFVEQATLNFSDSKNSPGIQAADLIAGFVMRYTKKVLHDRRSPSHGERVAFKSVARLVDTNLGLGINHFMSSVDRETLYSE